MFATGLAERDSNPGERSSAHRVSRHLAVLLLVIVLLGILARLYHLDAPLLEVHPPRQYDTAAIARNFYEGSMNIFYPQVDWGGDSPGYVEAEFQIYTFLVAIAYRLFGLHEWLGRVLNIGVYALSALLLCRLSRRLFNEPAALLAVLFYSLVPLSFIFTRTVQPDALMALCSLAGVYYFWIWTEDERWTSLALSAVGITLAALLKPLSLYLGLPLAYLAHHRFGWRFFRKPVLWLFAVAVLVPPLLWYAHAADLWEKYGNSFFRFYVVWGYPSLTDQVWLGLGKNLLTRLAGWIATPAGFLLLIVGFFAKPPRRNYLLHWWAAGFALSILLAPRNHWGHNYYQLPFVFGTTAWMGYGAVVLWNKGPISLRVWRTAVAVLCLSVAGFSLWKIRQVLRIPEQQIDHVAFGERVNRLTEPSAAVLIVWPRVGLRGPNLFLHRTAQGEYFFCNPVDLYLSHRKGWAIDETDASPQFVETLRQRGVKYFATFFPEIFKRHPELKAALDQSYMALEVTPKWAIYRLDLPSAKNADISDEDRFGAARRLPAPLAKRR